MVRLAGLRMAEELQSERAHHVWRPPQNFHVLCSLSSLFYDVSSVGYWRHKQFPIHNKDDI